MAKLTADKVLTQQHVRGFIQYGGAGPENEAQYYGIRNQYFFVSGISNPQRGGISPINVPDPRRRKVYERVGRTIDPPDFSTYTLTVHHKHGTVPKALGQINCPLTVYLTTGKCKDPSDLNRGYESYVYILSGGEVTESSPGDMFMADSDDALATELSITTADQYAVGPLYFGESAATEVNAEVIDIVYDIPRVCAGCDEGNERVYAVSKSIGGSPTFQPEVHYTIDGGSTWNSVNITGLGATALPSAIDIVGEYVVVVVNGSGGYYYAQLDEFTGAPGTWTLVTTGFNAAGAPNDIYVVSPTEIYFVGNGGYIYLSRDIAEGVTTLSAAAATTADLQRIHGDGDETIVAVGESGAIVRSLNRGVTWGSATTTPTNATITAVQVIDDDRWWIGTSGGKVYYTISQASAWTEQSPPSATVIQDILFATEEVGYIAYTIAGPTGYLYNTIDGGNTWVQGRARVPSFPTIDRANRLAAPVASAQTAVNYLAVGGLAGDGSDGVILIGAANIL